MDYKDPEADYVDFDDEIDDSEKDWHFDDEFTDPEDDIGEGEIDLGGGSFDEPSAPVTTNVVMTLRACVETAEGDVPSKSAALSYLVLQAEPGIDHSDLPWPAAGARPDQAIWWPCVYLARRDDDLFPGGRKTAAAQRQALRRAVKSAESVIDHARMTFALGLEKAA